MPIIRNLRVNGKEYRISIIGVKCTPLNLRDVEEILHRKALIEEGGKVEVVLLNADMILGKEHLMPAIYMALRRHLRGKGLAKKLSVEVVLYAACTKEIVKAHKILGIREGVSSLVVVIIGEVSDPLSMIKSLLGDKFKLTDDGVLDLSEDKIRRIRKAFNISDKEVKSLQEESLYLSLVKSIISRMALLNLIKP